ncbi:MAG: hypothetical protein EU549_04060 [Promethearchaeota archaeon]|nr:MAG: hypothetical protein EU549_04060 [Candidatus Lokiarchaeota archaeon]
MPSKIRSVLHLLRIRQYYKNGLIFVGIFFSERLFDFPLYFSLLIGFVLLCCSSSFNYIVNDLHDIEHDKIHLEKIKKKPLASGEISKTSAILLLILLALIMALGLVFFVPNLMFVLMLLAIIITGQVYNLIFKYYAFIDVLVLSTGYLWRALAGCALINEYVSAWLFLAIFEIAMFLSIAKRKGDLTYLGKEKAVVHKKVYDQYSLKLLDQFHTVIATSLFMTYALYLILKFNLLEPETVNFNEYIAIFSIPISLYIIMRYMYLTSSKPEMARKAETAFFDKGIIIAGFSLAIILFWSFYYDMLFV